MQKAIGRLFSPSQEGWIWIAGLICVILLIQFYEPASIVSDPIEDLPVITPLPATSDAAFPVTPTQTPAATRTPAASSTRAKATQTATPVPVYHTVQAGEMPLSIAAEYDLDVETLLEINDIEDPAGLQIGQQLIIPVTPTPDEAPPPTATPTRRRGTPTPAPTLVFHTVSEGDTLLAIAYEYDTTVEAITAVNWLSNPHSLQLDQKLLIPPADGSMPDPLLWAPRIVHEIEAGETLITIAQEYGSTVDDIMAVNSELDPNTMQIGYEITIPLTRQKAAGQVQTSGGGGGLSKAASLSIEQVLSLKAGSPTLSDLEQAMIAAVNAERQARKLPPYQVDEELTLMAWQRAQDMITRDYVSHVTPEGNTLRDRFRALNWPTPLFSENIYLSTLPPGEAVERTMSWFMGDAPHRAGIINTQFNRMGIGVAESSSGWTMFVQVFAQK